MFYISDGKSNNEKDVHLNIVERDYDFKFMMDCVIRNELKYITLETPKQKLNSFDEDL